MTKIVDSTVSQLLQENSSIEYVAPEKDSIATIPNETQNCVSANPLFDFAAVHNGEACIESLDPKDRGTERQFRFTRALLCTLLGVKSDNTISNHIEALLKRGVLKVVKNLTTLKIPTNGGMQETVLYDLKVFNYLVMRLDTDQAWEKKAKFNDVLVERETQTQSVQPTVPSYMLASEEERAIAWAEEHRQARLALEAKEREIKSLQAQKDVMRQEYKSNKDFCNELIAKGVAVQKNGKPYALSTLRSRMSPILQEVSHTYRYSISEETVVVDGVERKTPYYHRDVCDMIAAVVTPQWLAKPTTDIITMKQ